VRNQLACHNYKCKDVNQAQGILQGKKHQVYSNCDFIMAYLLGERITRLYRNAHKGTLKKYKPVEGRFWAMTFGLQLHLSYWL
jgi:hypothetical protein